MIKDSIRSIAGPFLLLRISEFLFATLTFFCALALFNSHGPEIIAEFPASFVQMAQINLMYAVGFYYIPFSFILFIVFYFFTKFDLPWANTIPFLLHSSPFVWGFGRNPFAPELWLEWVAIIIFNFMFARVLLNIGWLKPWRGAVNG